MEVLFLLAIAILPVFFVGMYIYKKDRNKEPAKLLTKLFFSGIGSCFLVLIITPILERIFPILNESSSNLDLIELIFYVFIGIALVEESCKWIMAYKLSYNDDEFDELYDMILYCVFVSLGFACFENIFYVFEYGLEGGILRAITSIPGHTFFAVIMGYNLGLAKYYSLYKDKDKEKLYKIKSIFFPMLAHGIFDYTIMTENLFFILIFFIFIIIMYIYIVKKTNKISSINRKMKYKDNFCPICGTKVTTNYCPKCGRKNE